MPKAIALSLLVTLACAIFMAAILNKLADIVMHVLK